MREREASQASTECICRYISLENRGRKLEKDKTKKKQNFRKEKVYFSRSHMDEM